MPELERLAQAESMLAEIASTDDALDLIDKAEVARVWAQRAKLGTSAVNHATSIKMRAERRLADAVDAGQAAGAIATRKLEKRSEARTFSELGVDKRRLAEARTIRDSFTDSDIARLAAAATAADRELSRTELVRTARKTNRQEAAAEAVNTVITGEVYDEIPAGEVRTIVADPPWRYGNTKTRGAAQDHYPTMSIEEIRALPVARERAADRAHLYLWTTASHLPQAFSVMEAWGFEYKTYLVWVKPQMGMGNYFRVSTELVLFGVRGGMVTNDKATKNWFEVKRGAHSAKPEMFQDIVMKSSPGPYLEMFARCYRNEREDCRCSRCRLGWEVWGNQS